MKKVMAILLVLVITVGMATTGFAAAGGKITDVLLPIDTNSSYDIDNAKAGVVWYYPLTANMFEWSEGTGGASEPVTKQQISNATVSVKTTNLDSSIIKEVSLVYRESAKAGGKTTATVKVEFVEEFVSTKSVDFKTSIYLALKTSRKEASKLVLDGTFENTEKKVNSSTDYVSIAKGEVLVPTEYIKEIEIDLGSGVLMQTRLYASQKYYGVAKEEVTTADATVLNRYNDIETIVVLKTVNLKSSGNIVLLDGYEGYYIYDVDGKYLGQAKSEKLFPYSEKYYLASSKIDMGGGTASSAGSSSSSSSSSSGSSVAPPAAGTAITTSSAKSQTQAAIQTAKSSGSTVASVRFKDAGSISPAALKEIKDTASAAGMTAKLVADTMSGTAVSGRLTISASSTIASDIKLGVYVDSASVKSTKDKFEKWFKNNIVVISLAQKGSYGTQVSIAAKVSVSSLNTSSLVFYSYNTSTNQYSKIANPGYTVDSNGYLHFNTTNAGDIIVTDSALAVR